MNVRKWDAPLTSKQHVKSIQIDMSIIKILKIVETLAKCFWNETLYKDNEK